MFQVEPKPIEYQSDSPDATLEVPVPFLIAEGADYMSGKKTKLTTGTTDLLDMRTAADLAGYSPRQFKQIITEDRIPTRLVEGRRFVTAEAFEKWKSTKGERRLRQAMDQVDRWLSSLPEDQRWIYVENRPEPTPTYYVEY